MYQTSGTICTNSDSTEGLVVDDLVVLVKHIVERLIHDALVDEYTRDSSFHAKNDVVNQPIGSILCLVIGKIASLEEPVFNILFV